jgi:hypothetical protein
MHEIIDSRELAKRFGLPLTWVQNHTRSHCKDPIPQVRIGALVRFEWESPALEAWWNEHRKHYSGTASHPEGTAVPEERVVALRVLPGSSQRERGAKLAADVLKSRAA